jgi:hypothetical protein
VAVDMLTVGGGALHPNALIHSPGPLGHSSGASGHLPFPGGGYEPGLGTLSAGEFQAAQNALSKISSSAGTLGNSLGNLAQNAAAIGGALHSNALQPPSLLHGTGSDTFVGGARSSLLAGIGSDTVVGGSAKALAASAGVVNAQNISDFALSADTVSPAGVTALSIKQAEPDAGHKAHTVSVGDKTIVTISGLSSHEISKLSH